MARVTAAQFSDKWSRRTQAAVPDYQSGIDRVSVAPGQAAAAAQDVMLAHLNEAVQSGRWAQKVASVPLTDWKAAAKTKGGQRIAAGVQGASTKMQSFASKFLPYLDAGAQQVNAMPKLTLEDRINRAVAMMRYNAGFKGS